MNTTTQPRVLYVEDDPQSRKTMDLLFKLRMKLAHVTMFENSESFLERAEALYPKPDVILLDALMPGMDGFEVARHLKADPATEPIPIIFMTGLTDAEHVVAAFAAGSSDYVTKPIRPSEVLARITAHVQSARQTQQARSVLDAYGQACVSMRPSDGALLWQTPLARTLLQKYGGEDEHRLVARIHAWLHAALAKPHPPAHLEIRGDEGRMVWELIQRSIEQFVGVYLFEHVRGAAERRKGAFADRNRVDELGAELVEGIGDQGPIGRDARIGG